MEGKKALPSYQGLLESKVGKDQKPTNLPTDVRQQMFYTKKGIPGSLLRNRYAWEMRNTQRCEKSRCPRVLGGPGLVAGAFRNHGAH